MSCNFQTLYLSEDGYVVKCDHCGHYQVAFGSLCITLEKSDLEAFTAIVTLKKDQAFCAQSEHSKSVFIQTPAEGIFFILSCAETRRFHAMLEEADNEEKALNLLELFNH